MELERKFIAGYFYFLQIEDRQDLVNSLKNDFTGEELNYIVSDIFRDYLFYTYAKNNGENGTVDSMAQLRSHHAYFVKWFRAEKLKKIGK